MWEFLKKVHKVLGVSNHPRLGWTVIGLALVIAFNFWAGAFGSLNTIDKVQKWAGDNKALMSIVLLAICIGIGSHLGLWKAINDQQDKIENLGKEINDQQKKTEELSNKNS